MPTATLTSKGQTTIPQKIREHLGLQPGDRLEFVVQADGSVLMVPATVRLADLKGILLPPGKPIPPENMEQAMRIQGRATRKMKSKGRPK
ncbi:MAG: type II toxin-antitoxin system PrlF family antitoxin [Proteobacteria bacterium]|nr:type II toxin-antitoxin system PrlF family antitoxin [Pseudomonadota bacterium]